MSLRDHYEWVILVTGVLVVFAAIGLGRFGYTMILPSMQAGLSLSTSMAGDLAAANMVGYLLLAITSGFLASRYGPRIVIIYSLLLVTASMAVTALSASYRLALVARFVTGAGGGGANVPIMGLMAAWFTKEKRGLAAGLTVGGSSLGLLLTGIIVPQITARYGGEGWRISWFVLAAIAGTVLIISIIFLKDKTDSEISVPTQSSKGDMIQVLKERRIWLLSILYVAFGFSYVIYATFFARALISDHAIASETAGFIWSGVGLMSIFSGFVWGMFSDRFGRKPALVIVFLLQTLSYSLFALVHTPVGFVISGVLFAFSAFSVPAIMSAAAGDLLGSRLAPAGFGVLTLSFGIGQILGPMVGGRVAEAAGSFYPSFLTAAVAAFAGCICALTLLPKSFQQEHKRGN